MTILELAHELEITEMAVRRHIQTLERDKLIHSDVKKQTLGRPSKVYQLAEQGEDLFPKKYKEFSIELLQGLIEAGQEKLVQDILIKNIAQRLEHTLELLEIASEDGNELNVIKYSMDAIMYSNILKSQI